MHDEDPNDQAAPKQLKLWDTPRVTQKGVDERLVDFVVNGVHPLSVVEEPGFQRLIKYLQPNASASRVGPMSMICDTIV